MTLGTRNGHLLRTSTAHLSRCPDELPDEPCACGILGIVSVAVSATSCFGLNWGTSALFINQLSLNPCTDATGYFADPFDPFNPDIIYGDPPIRAWVRAVSVGIAITNIITVEVYILVTLENLEGQPIGFQSSTGWRYTRACADGDGLMTYVGIIPPSLEFVGPPWNQRGPTTAEIGCAQPNSVTITLPAP